MQVILDSSFARPGSAPIWGGKKGELRDWTKFVPGPLQKNGFVTEISFCKTPVVDENNVDFSNRQRFKVS